MDNDSNHVSRKIAGKSFTQVADDLMTAAVEAERDRLRGIIMRAEKEARPGGQLAYIKARLDGTTKHSKRRN